MKVNLSPSICLCFLALCSCLLRPSLSQSTPLCASPNSTFTSSLTTNSTSIYIESLSPLYDNFNVIWEESTSPNVVDVSISICSNNATVIQYFMYMLANVNGSVYLILQQASSYNSSQPGGSTNGSTSSSSSGTTGGGATTNSTTGSNNSSTTAGTATPPPGTPSTSKGFSNAPSLSFIALIGALSLFVSSRSRMSLVVLLLAIALMANVHTATAQSSSNTTLTITISVPASMTTFCVSGQCFAENSTSGVTDYVSFAGKRYASLASLYGGTCNTSTIMMLPSNWTLAPPTTETLVVIDLYNWNTYSVITSDGTGWKAGSYGVEANVGYLLTLPNHFGQGVTGYQVEFCASIILITQDFPIPEPDHEIIGAPTITNFITFNGYDYAVADNTPYNDTTPGCETFDAYLDSTSQWQLAPNDPASLIVIQSSSVTFGTLCIVANDTAYGQNLTPCAHTEMKSLAYDSGFIYSVPNCSRILIQRSSTLGNTWVTQVNITNTFVYEGVSIATLDNAPVVDVSASSCQPNFMSVPSGWSLLSSSQLSSFVSSQGWAEWPSTYCLVTNGLSLDRSGANCTASLITEVVNGVPYYQTSTCARILITQP